MTTNILRSIALTTIVTLSIFTAVLSCKKDPCKDVSCLNNGTCSNGNCQCPTGYTGTRCETELPGKVVFWTDEDCGGNITVTCNGTDELISSYYTTGNPGCDASGCATYNLATGTYNYTAANSVGSWSGTVTVYPGQCTPLQLTCGGGSTGQVMFWCASNFGTITVSCDGYSGSITEYYYSGTPTCGAAGCVTFTLPVGTYSFSASNGPSKWNHTVTVTAGGCFKEQLD